MGTKSNLDDDPVHGETEGMEENIKAEETEEAADHARIDDPVEPPARHAPKARDSLDSTSSGMASSKKSNFEGTSILSRLFDPDRKQKPQLWAHIKLVAPGPADCPPDGHLKWRSKDAIAAYCLKCKKQFTYTKGTSKTISRHMQAFHGLVLNESSTPTADSTNKSPSIKRNSDGALSSPPLKKRKPDLNVMPSSQALLLKWLAGSFRPFSMVRDPGLQALVSNLSSGFFTLPAPDELLRLAMETQESIKLELRRLLKDCDSYSLSCQSFENRGSSYVALQVTFCTSLFQRLTATLAVVAGSCNKATIMPIMDEFGLTTDKISHVTVQGMDPTVELGLGEAELDICILTSLDELIFTPVPEGEVGEVLTEIRGYVQYHYGWIKAGGVLAKTPETFASTSNSLVDVYNMLLRCQDPVDKEGDSGWAPNDSQKVIMAALLPILKPFYDATTTLSRETCPTLGLAIPVFRRIQDVLEKLDVSEHANGDKNVETIMSKFLEDLLKTFSSTFATFFDENCWFLWTIPLDPRLVHMGGLSDKEKESVTEKMVENVKELRIANQNKTNGSISAVDDGNKSSVDNLKSEESTMGGIFWGHDSEEPDSLSSTKASTSEAALTYAKASVDRYFTKVRSQRRIDNPLGWWDSNQRLFPELAQLARKWLGASSLGVKADGRSTYSEDNLELVCFLHDNVDLMDSEVSNVVAV